MKNGTLAIFRLKPIRLVQPLNVITFTPAYRIAFPQPSRCGFSLRSPNLRRNTGFFWLQTLGWCLRGNTFQRPHCDTTEVPLLPAMTIFRPSFRPTACNSFVHRNSLRSISLSRNCAFVFSQTAMETIGSDHELFEYTSGRWMYVLISFVVKDRSR
jgi:hypothetical protein